MANPSRKPLPLVGNQMKNTALRSVKEVGFIAAVTTALEIGRAYQATFGGYIIIGVIGLILYVISAAISVLIYRIVRYFIRLWSGP